MKGFFSKKLRGSRCALWGCFALAVLFAAGDAQAQQPPAGKPVVALIPDGSERVAPLADLLFAELSKSQRVNLVERAELKKIRAEQELQLSFGAKGGKSRRRLGSLLSADFLVLLRIGGADESPALETVIAETRFGYRLVKQAQKWDPKQVEVAAREIATLLDGSLDRFSRGVTFAVAVPPLFSRNLTHRFDHLQAAYARVAEVEATRRPGCAVVELEEAKAIAEELAVGAGDDKVTRPLPYYIVGEFRHETLQPDSPVTITLRLRHGAEQLAELSSRGLDAATAAKFVRKTTDGLLNKIGNGRVAGIPATDPAKEVRTLLSRAKGFLEVGALDESAALYEAALLLDPRNIDTLDGAVESYVRMIQLPLSRRSPGKSNEAEWEQWNELRKKEMRLKAYQAIRASEHLTRLVQIKKYDRFFTMRNRVESLWGAARQMTQYGRFEGLDEELLLLEQARRDFLLYGFPHTWREKGWRDWREMGWTERSKKREYTRCWFYLITVIGFPSQQKFPDKDWFDYRLKLFQAVYKGKSRWYAHWLWLPKGCEDGSWATRYGAGAVQKYVKLHESFVEQFKQVCDDPQGLALSLEYVRLQREFSHRRKQPDLVVLMELTWLYCQCEAAEIWEGKRALLDLLNETAGRHYASVPRFKPPTPGPYRPPLPKAGDAVRIGRLAFQPVKLHFTGVDATVPRSDPASLSQDGAYVVVHGLVQCSPGIDVLWGPASIAVMKEKGRAVEVFRDTKAEISDACFDGKWFWAATRTGRILLVDPVEGTVKVIGAQQGVPDSGAAMVVCPFEPGRICAAGAIPPHARAWCATVTAEGEVHVFHEARRIAEKEDDAAADCAFKPSWVFPIQSADGKSVDRLLLCRNGQNHHANRYSLHGHPLVIDPKRLTVEVLDAKMPLGVAHLRRKDVVQTGEFLFFGTMAVKLADMSYHIQVTNPQGGGRLCHRRSSRSAFKLGDMLYLPPDDGNAWIEVDPKTVTGEIIAEGYRLPKWNDYTYYRSWHYEIFGLSHFSRSPHYQVSVLKKAAGKHE